MNLKRAILIGGALFLFFLFLLFLRPSQTKQVYLGAYDSSRSVRPSFNLATFYHHLGIVAKRYDWEKRFPKKFAVDTLEQGAIPFIYWEPTEWYDRDIFRLSTIIDGIWDDHIVEWAKDVRQFEYPVFISFAPFPNSSKSPWGSDQGREWTDLYKSATLHVISIFKEEGADNALWVMSLTNDLGFLSQDHLLKKLYPGHDVIDAFEISAIDVNPEYQWGELSMEDHYKSSLKLIQDYPKFTILSNIPLRTVKDKESIEKAIDSSLSSVQAVMFTVENVSENVATLLTQNTRFQHDSEDFSIKRSAPLQDANSFLPESENQHYSVSFKDIYSGSNHAINTPGEKAELFLSHDEHQILLKGKVHDSSNPEVNNTEGVLLETTDSIKLTMTLEEKSYRYGFSLRNQTSPIWNYDTYSESGELSIEEKDGFLYWSLPFDGKINNLKRFVIEIIDVNADHQRIIYRKEWRHDQH